MKLLIFALYALFVYSEGRNLPAARYEFGDSYIDDVKLSYENGIWQCDRIVCPLGVYGCKILRQNDPNNSLQLIRTNICFHKNDGIGRSAFTTEAVPAHKTVNINVTSFEGAQSVYLTTYTWSPITGETSQLVSGIVAPEKWAEAQELSRETIENVEAKPGGSLSVVKY